MWFYNQENDRIFSADGPDGTQKTSVWKPHAEFGALQKKYTLTVTFFNIAALI